MITIIRRSRNVKLFELHDVWRAEEIAIDDGITPVARFFDPKSSPEQPRWQCVDVRFVRKTALLSPAALRQHPALLEMTVLQRGNRLSITPVTPQQWHYLMENLL